VFFFITITLAAVHIADGRPSRIAKTPDKGRNFGCGTCHLNSRGGGMRNAFGQDYQKIALKAGDKYSKELGEKDSDGDGFTNDQEFAAKTHPGNPESKPQ
jgi:hypothetical protein